MPNTIAFYTSLAEINRKVCTDSNPSHQLVEKNPHHLLFATPPECSWISMKTSGIF
jgi:hypothetical protein